ncbi:MAG TPA: DUF2269 family protein [bacterium]|nr:DUF2269 family protein [bacterium]
MYEVAKFLHVFGAVLLLGNAIVSALWKAGADRTGDAVVAGTAARTIGRADRAFVIPGAILLIGAGYAMAARRPWPLHGLPWLEWGQGLLYLAILVWLLVLVPAQRRMASLAGGARGGPLPDAYVQASRRWAMWGGVVTLSLLIALFLMAAKP